MGEIVEFPSNGSTCSGYLAARGAGPGVVVIQEWWGLVDHIKDVCDRFAAEGFVALAPDLYHGRSTKEPDEAGKMMMALRTDDAARDMAGAVGFLLEHERVRPKKVGVTGFCMGGALTLHLSTVSPVAAAAPFYGIPSGDPDWSRLAGPVLFHVAEHDEWVSPSKANELAEGLRALGKDVELHVYPGTHHAFFNDTRPDVYDPEAARLAWDRTLAFFRRHLA